MRGGIATGQYRELGPIFPETGKGNLVGHAVVEAVELEKTEVKGPRLFVSEAVAATLASQPIQWLLDSRENQPPELLWLLPPDPEEANGTMISDVCRASVDQFVRHAHLERAGLHYASYLDLVVRALERLCEHNPREARSATDKAGFDRLPSAKDVAAQVEQQLKHRAVRDRLEQL